VISFLESGCPLLDKTGLIPAILVLVAAVTVGRAGGAKRALAGASAGCTIGVLGTERRDNELADGGSWVLESSIDGLITLEVAVVEALAEIVEVAVVAVVAGVVVVVVVVVVVACCCRRASCEKDVGERMGNQ
jgi:hypothetical protein